MVKLKFLFDEKKDLQNIYNKANNPFGGMSPISQPLIEIAKGKSYEKCVEDLKKYLQLIYSSPLIGVYIEEISKGWAIIEKDYFYRLKSITNKEFPLNIKEIKVYLTTISTCPYNLKEHSFMINFFSSLCESLKIIGHELMHFHFHYYYFKDIEKQIGKKRTMDIKEALTALLNLEFKDLWLVIDKGYSHHKELREFIVQEWGKEKDFDKLLEKTIGYIQKTERRLNKDEILN